MNEARSIEPSGNWLAEILVRYEKPLLKHAYGICSDRELSRDAVQETFFRLIRTRDKGMPENLAAWLFTVCRNVLTDHIRRQRMVAALPERERELVRLKFQVGLSYKEIEAVTGISQGNIGYFLHRAVKELKDRWQREGGEG